MKEKRTVLQFVSRYGAACLLGALLLGNAVFSKNFISFLPPRPARRVLLHQLNDNRCQRDKKQNPHNAEKLPSHQSRNQGIKRRKSHRAPHHPGINKLIFQKLYHQIYDQASNRC